MQQPFDKIKDAELVELIQETNKAVLQGLSVPGEKLRLKLHEYFSRNDVDAGDHGFVLSAFTPGWLPKFQFMTREIESTEAIWYELVLPICEDWERNNHPRKIHKGTLYYFWAITVLQRGDIDRAFLLMHKALEEDQRESGKSLPDQPALKFARLDDDPNQFGYAFVLQYIRIVENYLVFYNRDGGQLSFQQFCDWFLKSSEIVETVFAFAHAIGRLSALRTAGDMADTTFGNLIRIEIMFRLLQVIENALRAQNPDGGPFRKQVFYLVEIANQHGMRLNIESKDMDRLATESRVDFEKTLSKLITDKFFDPQRDMNLLNRDIAISYVSRNQSAHRISTIGFDRQSYTILLSAAFNTLFLTIQILYPPKDCI